MTDKTQLSPEDQQRLDAACHEYRHELARTERPPDPTRFMERVPERLRECLHQTLAVIATERQTTISAARTSIHPGNPLASVESKPPIPGLLPPESSKSAAAASRSGSASPETVIISQTPETNDDPKLVGSKRAIASIAQPGSMSMIAEIVPSHDAFHKYVVEQEIDRGSMGVVLRVRDQRLKRTIALKVIRGQERTGSSARKAVDAGTLQRFIREAQITGRLDHPGVVPIHELAKDENERFYFTMKYVEGHTLKDVLQEYQNGSEQWTLSRITEAMIRVCETLAFAHSKEVIHRDLKPSNVMVGKFGEVYVMDWGLAKVLGEVESEFTSTVDSQDDSSGYNTTYGTTIGTPFYMPPEQAAGMLDTLDCRSDVYAVGAILYEILTGQRPYWSDPPPTITSVIRQIIDGPPKDIRELNRKAAPELAAIAQKAMNRNMEERYQSAADLAEDLRAFLSQRIVSAHNTGMMTRLKKWMIRNQGLTIASMLVLLTTLAAVCIIAVRESINLKEIQDRNVKLKQSIRDKELAQRESSGLSLLSHSKSLIEAGNPELASLLAIEALQMYPDSQTKDVLYAAADKVVPSKDLKVPGNLLTSDFAWIPGGRGLVSVGYGHGYIRQPDNSVPSSQLINRQQRMFRAVNCSADGTKLLTCGHDGTLAMWDSNSGLRTLEMDIGYAETLEPNRTERPDLLDVAFCLNERCAVTVSSSRKVHLIDLEASRQIAAMEIPATGDVNAADAEVTAMRVSPDGRVVVIGDKAGHLHLWNLEQQKLIRSMKALYQQVSDISFSADSRRFVASSEQESDSLNSPSDVTNIWSSDSGESLTAFDAKGLSVICAAWHPTQSIVAFGLSDATVCLWDADTSSVLSVSDRQPDTLLKIRFAPNGRLLATQCGRRNIVLWQLVRLAELPRLLRRDFLTGHQSPITLLEFDETSQRLASGSRDIVRTWQTSTMRPVPSFGSTIHPFQFQMSPTGHRVFAANSDGRQGSLWSLPELKQVAEIDFGGPILKAEFSKTTSHLVTMTTDGVCKVWNAATGVLQSTVQNPFAAWTHSLVGQRLILTGQDATNVWDLSTGKLLRSVPKNGALAHLVALDGTLLLADLPNGDTRNLSLTNLITGATTEIKDVNISSLSNVSASGRLICATHNTTEDALVDRADIAVVDLESNSILFSTQVKAAEILYSTISSDDSRLLISYRQHPSCAAEIYSIPSGERLQQIGEPKEEIPGWNSTFERIVTRSTAQGTRLWNGFNGTLIQRLDSTATVDSVAFSSDGSRCAVHYQPTPESNGLNLGTVTIRNANDGTMISALPGQNAFGFECAFVPHQKKLLTLSGSGCLRLWPTDIEKTDFAVLDRVLTNDERRMYGLGQAPVQSENLSPHNRAWADLDEQIRLLIPVTTERRKPAWTVLDDVEKWMQSTSSAPEKSQALKSVDRLITGSFDTDPEVLSRIARLHQTYGNKMDAARMMENAARHPRASSLADRLKQLQTEIAPAVVSEKAVDDLFEAARLTSDSSDMLSKTKSWAEANSSHFDAYIKARTLQLNAKYSEAAVIFESIVDNQATGPETLLHCAECQLELGQVDQAHKVLHAGLSRDQTASPDVWNMWLRVGFHDLKLSPQLLLEKIPNEQPRMSGDIPQRQHIVQLLTTLAASNPVRINCGGDRYIAANGDLWMADAFYNSGFEFFGMVGDSATFSSPIRNTTDEVLYQSERYFDHNRTDLTPGYHIPLPDGAYTVLLGFAEIFQANRSFSVRIENTPVRSNYDPSRSEEDWATAQQIEIPILIEDGQFDLYFEQLNGTDPKISCIQLTPKLSGSKGQ